MANRRDGFWLAEQLEIINEHVKYYKNKNIFPENKNKWAR